MLPAGSDSIAAMNRYPRRGSVSIKRGVSAESPSASRNRLIAVLRPCSKSTNVSEGQSDVAQLFARDERARTLEQTEQNAARVFLQSDPHAGLSELSRVERQLEC